MRFEGIRKGSREAALGVWEKDMMSIGISSHLVNRLICKVSMSIGYGGGEPSSSSSPPCTLFHILGKKDDFFSGTMYPVPICTPRAQPSELCSPVSSPPLFP